MTVEDREAALLRQVADGDHDAFATLYDRLSPLLYGTCKRVLHDSSHAEEVTQEVFVEIWRQASRFDGSRGSARTWAAMIARRRAVDRVRSEQAHRDRQGADAAVMTMAPAGPDEEAVERDLRARATAALGQLSVPQREALELAYFDGYTHVEIADRLGIALGTAKTRLRDGMIRLRQVLETT